MRREGVNQGRVHTALSACGKAYCIMAKDDQLQQGTTKLSQHLRKPQSPLMKPEMVSYDHEKTQRWTSVGKTFAW